MQVAFLRLGYVPNVKNLPALSLNPTAECQQLSCFLSFPYTLRESLTNKKPGSLQCFQTLNSDFMLSVLMQSKYR